MGKWADALKENVPETETSGKWSQALKGTQKSSDKSYLEEMGSNIIPSALEYGKAVTSPIHSPIKTAKGVVELAGELDPVQHIMNAMIEGKPLFPGIRGIANHFGQRYGGLDKLKETFKADPVGVLADLSTFLTGVGGIAPKLGKVGQAIEPLNIVKRVVTAPAKIIPNKIPEKLFESGAKFSTKLSAEDRLRNVHTAFQEEINLTRQGLDKTKGTIKDIQNKVSTAVDEADKLTHGQMGFYQGMDVKDLFQDWNKLFKQASLSTTPVQDINALYKIKRDITSINNSIRGGKLSPKELQEMKTGIYDRLEGYYSKAVDAPISVKARKSIARTAKEELEGIIPEIKQLNAREGALIELRDTLETSTNRLTNRDLLGIGLPIKTIAGAAVGGTEAGIAGAASGLALGLLDLAPVKGKLAIVLNRLKEKGITIKPTQTALRLGLFETRDIGEEKLK
jgi:hypothetical protein